MQFPLHCVRSNLGLLHCEWRLTEMTSIVNNGPCYPRPRSPLTPHLLQLSCLHSSKRDEFPITKSRICIVEKSSYRFANQTWNSLIQIIQYSHDDANRNWKESNKRYNTETSTRKHQISYCSFVPIHFNLTFRFRSPPLLLLFLLFLSSFWLWFLLSVCLCHCCRVLLSVFHQNMRNKFQTFEVVAGCHSSHTKIHHHISHTLWAPCVLVSSPVSWPQFGLIRFGFWTFV